MSDAQQARPPVRGWRWPASERSALLSLAGIGAVLAVLTFAVPFAFGAAQDNAVIALTIPAGLLTIVAAKYAERVPARRTLWLILGLAVVLRVFALSFEPLLSDDIYRYIWDGKVQAAGINPYRYIPADPMLSALRDTTVYPRINRADYALTIYPPVAQFFFWLVTRFGTSTTVMRVALLVCEAGGVIVILLLLRLLQQPATRVVAYVWHPLPVWEIANSGHVDGLMVFLMLLGLWFVLGGRPVRGAVLVTAAALVKPFAAPALAVIWRPWNWKVAFAVVATIGICYVPYLSVGWNVLGFLTQGYFKEEGLASGEGIWLLGIWRLLFGAHRGDVAVYCAFAGAVMLPMALQIWRRPAPNAAAALAAINKLLLAFLVLSSPNYPWYFLVITPFVALCGNASTWAASIGALLLTNEVEWDFSIPPMIAKSLLFGSVLLAGFWPILNRALLNVRMERKAE